MTTQRYEIEAWLGDARDEMTDEQIEAFCRIADEIGERYPDPDDADEREAALITAHQILMGETDVVDELAGSLTRARTAEFRALAGLRQAATMLVPDGRETEAGFARHAGVDRMAVRGWLGKR